MYWLRGRLKSEKKYTKWQDNARFTGHAFVFAAEHGVANGYVSEKAFVAAAAGAVPIYWGDSKTLFKFMNPERIILYNRTLSEMKTFLYKRNLNAVNTSYILMQARKLVKVLMKL